MRKFLLFLVALLILSKVGTAQVATYTFNQSVLTYTAISGGTVLVDGTSAMDSWVSGAITIPSFTFNGVAYTTAYVTSNGILSLGATAASSTAYNGVSAGTGGGICICPFSADLNSATATAASEIRWQTVGNEVIFQWQQMQRYLQTESFDMQVRLNTVTNAVVMVYKLNSGPGSGTSYMPEVGIRTSATDFNNRLVGSGAENWGTSLSGVANTDLCRFTSTAPAKNFTTGLTYTFAPAPVGTPLPPTTPNPANASAGVPVNGSLTWTFGTNSVTYDLMFGPTGFMTQVVTGAAAGATGSYTYAGLTASSVYQWQVIEHNGALTTNGPTWSFTTACAGIATFPWTENFDAMGSVGSNIFPNCWIATSPSGTPWYTGNAGSITYNDPCSAPNYAYVYYIPSSVDKFLISPPFTLTAGTIYQYQFKWVGDGYSGWTGDVLVNTSASGTGATLLSPSFVVAATTTTTVCAQASRSFVPATTGTYYFMIRVNNSGVPYYLGFDDFSLTVSPPCTTPPAQATSLVLTPTVYTIAGSFTAAAGADKYLVVRSLSPTLSASPAYGTVYTVGSSLGGGVVEYYGTATTFTSTGLTAATQYYYFIFSANDLLCSGIPTYLTTNPLTGNTTTNTITPISGTKNIGPTGDFFTLTAAFQYLNENGVSGPVNLVLQSTYVSTVEPAFPIPALTIPGASATNKVTVYPSITGLSITSNSATGTINLNGVNYVTFDGRVNATGSSKDLIIENSSTSGYTIQYVNGASNNIVKYCVVKGANTAGSNGTLMFSGTTGLLGNNNNLVDNCEIRDGVTNPLFAIVSAGSTSPSAYNTNNTISNCLIHDFYAPTGGNPIGVYFFSGSTAWTISGNSFYMSAKSPTVANIYFMIYVASGDGYSILNNYFGGSASNCGGTPWTLNGNGTPPTIGNAFYGIDFTTGALSSNPSSIQGNTMANIALYTSSTLSGSIKFVGIISTVGIQNIGDVSPNVFGSATGTGSIAVTVGNGAYTSSYEGIDFRGIYGNISNNVFGSFTLNGSSTSTYALLLRGFSITPTVQNGPAVVSGNLFGSATTSNSVQTLAGTNPPVTIQGVYCVPSGSGTLSIANNTVANITNLSATTTSYIQGIYSSGTGLPNIVSGNTVRDLTTTSTSTTLSGTGTSLIGLYSGNSVPGSIIRSNNIYNLTNTTGTAAVGINGIQLGHAAGNLLVEKNYIHNIALSTTSASAQICGLYMINSGTYATIKNNMIQLGVNPDGTANTSNCIINGIYESSATVDSVLNNSVYIGGAPAGTTGSTYAFNSVMSASLSSPRICLGNIFFNARSGGSTGKHYGIKIAGTLYAPVGVTSNYNLIIANGAIGGTFGYYNAADRTTFAAYKDASGTEMASGNSNPNFIAPTGNSATANLHVQNSTPIEAAGIALSSVTDDFDGVARSGLTPPDIGADAGNFTLSADVNGPNITYVPIGNGIIAATRVISNWASITDNVGVSTGASLPRIYYKKLTDANAFVGNTSANNGWKYVVASNATSPFSFTIDYSLLQAPVAAADIIQYFVVAQDAANNLSSSSLMAGSSANPPVQNINAAPTVGNIQQYSIVSGSIPTTITVPGTYPTLTGTNGAFDMINKGVLSGNTVINITGDLVEPGTVALSAWAEDPPGSNYTLKIQPDASSLRTISGTAVATGVAMIRTNGASRFTIDGGASKLLTFRNTLATAANTGPTIQFNGGSQNCFLKNCTIENNGTGSSYGAVNIGSTGVNIVEINGNDIRDATAGTTGRVYAGIYSATITNSLRIINNNIYNFINYGAYLSAITDGAVITGNSFYYNSATASSATQYCLYLTGGTNNHTISGNYFGGQSPLCAGTAWTNSTTNTIYGIYATLGIITPSTISNNTVQNFNLSNVGSASFNGIYITAGVVNVTNNIVGSSSSLTSIACGGTGGFYGIYVTPSSTAPSYIQGNTVSGISYTSTTNAGTFYFLYLSTGLYKAGTTSSNIIGSNTTAGSITYAGTGTLYGLYSGSSNPGNAIENNIIGNWSLTGTSGSPYARGLYVYCANVKKNKIFNISCTNAGLTPYIYGIYNYSYVASVTNEYSNNLVSLDAGAATNPTIYGYYDYGYYSSPMYNFYFNDISVSGPATGTSATYAFYRSYSTFYNFNNNIISNTRATGGTGKHYSMYISSTGNLNSNYNDLFSVAGPLGYYNAADQLTMSAWKAASAGDANSVNVDPQFVSA
ncbi:MAG: hypothetical protein WCI92_18755, partial [Bacteroidota bacterium]